MLISAYFFIQFGVVEDLMVHLCRRKERWVYRKGIAKSQTTPFYSSSDCITSSVTEYSAKEVLESRRCISKLIV